MVQETYLRYQATPPESIRDLKPFLTTIVTRLSLDQLKSARLQRESYIGPWLPEPLLTESGGSWVNPSGRETEYESISMAFLLLLEKLSPVERAVFLLREVFDYDYPEIARIVDKEEAACRQIFHRAKKHVNENRPRFHTTPEEHRHLIDRFLRATIEGDVDGLVSLLAEDVTSWSDGGGKVAGAATRPVQGRDKVARFMVALAHSRRAPQGLTLEIVEVNGMPAIVVRTKEGAPILVITTEVSGGLIRNFRLVANPDKLKHF